jgi:RinA family phage transcriptional activator
MDMVLDELIPRHVFRYVERELYDYHVHKTVIEEYLRAKKDTLSSWARQAPPSVHIGGKYKDGEYVGGKYVQSDAVGSGNVSDQVPSKVVRLMALENRAERALFYVKAIDDVLNTLPAEDQELVRLRYFECKLTNWQIARKLNVSESTLSRRRREIIRKFAIRFGLM